MDAQLSATDDAAARIEQLERALKAERAARDEAERASRAKAELLATVSHEIRTPLGAVISMAELLLTTPLDDRQRQFAETLRQSGRGLVTILNDLLDHSKLAAGRFRLESARFDLAAMMRSLAEALQARAADKGLAARVELAAGCPKDFVGDPARIRQVLDNLVDNALKFTESGSVRVRVAWAKDETGTTLRFEVRDTGIGIAEAQRAALFEPYAQGHASVGTRYGGTGLGLTIARQLATLMGGEIGCKSVEGRGSLFWFTVRVQEAGGAGTPAASDTRAAPGAGPPLSGRVLIVEDNATNQLLIQAFLDSFGLAHATAADGKAALEALERDAFDLVLMDIMMPGMDGIETTQAIRALDGPAAKLPIVALTANAMTGDRETYLAAGMDGYVAKPVSAAELHGALAAFLGGNAQSESQSA